MSTTNIFELAARNKVRFPSDRGELTIEAVFDLPLVHKSGFDLANLAKSIHNALQAVGGESFVRTAANPIKDLLELQLELVKHIIAVKQDEADEAAAAAGNKLEIKRLTDALARKQDEALLGRTAEQISARLAELRK